MRAFVGVPVIENDLAGFTQARAHIIRACPDWTSEKWVPPENLHLTLKFLGDIDLRMLDRLIDELSQPITQKGFQLPLKSLEAHPSSGRAGMIWAAFMDPHGRAAALHHHVDEIAAHRGIVSERRAFRPHVTLVRARRPRRVSREVLISAAGCVQSMSVLGVTVYTSTLTSRGAQYQEMAHVPLRID